MRTGPRNEKRGVTRPGVSHATPSSLPLPSPRFPSPEAPCKTPLPPQRLLQAQDRGRRLPGSRGQAQTKALLAFLDPRGDGYGWQEAHADVDHLVGMLGRVMEVRGHPLGSSVSRVGRA